MTVSQFLVLSKENLADVGGALERSLPRGHGRDIEVWHQGGMSVAFSATAQGNRVAHRDHRGFAVLSGNPVWKGQRLTASGILELLVERGSIHKWIEQVDGDFLIAAGEERTRQLAVARDKGGFIPGYVAGPIDGVWAASTNPIAAAFALGTYEFNDEFMARYVAIRYDEVWGQSKTFFKNVTQLAPASLYEGRGENQYWNFNGLPIETIDMTDYEAEEGFSALLLRSTKDCLDSLSRDSRVGIALSGGVDSSSVAAALSILGRNVEAITVTYPGRESISVEESSIARETAESLGHHWSGIPITSEVFLSSWQAVYDCQAFPLATSAQLGLTLLYAEASRRGISHLFIGGAGDDQFAGNYQHYLYNLADLLISKSNRFSIEYEQWINLHSTDNFPKDAGVFWDFLARNVDTSRIGKICPKPQILEPSLVRKEALNSLVFDPITVESTTYLKALTIYGAWFSMRPPGILQHHDTSWMSKIEIIDPYISPEFLKFGWTLSPYQKIREGQNKSIVRRAMSQFLPAGVTTRSEKVGFDVPFSQWMTLSSFRNFFIDVLDSKAAEFLNETIDLPRVLAHIKDAAYPRLNPMFVWQAVNGTLWRMNMQTRRDT